MPDPKATDRRRRGVKMPGLREVSLVLAYYDNADMLRSHVEVWRSYPQDLAARVRVVLVDDGSPNHDAASVLHSCTLGEEALSFLPLEMQVFRVIPNIPWNQDGARNLAMRHVTTEWAFLTDMDHVLPPGEAEKLLALDCRPKTYYMPNQLLTDGSSLGRPHPNSYLMRALDFWSMGGYDEDFAGYYGSDGNFRRCAKGAGLIETPTKAFSTVVYRSHDIFDANTKDWGRKGSPFHAALNPALRAKVTGGAYKASNPIRFAWQRVL